MNDDPTCDETALQVPAKQRTRALDRLLELLVVLVVPVHLRRVNLATLETVSILLPLIIGSGCAGVVAPLGELCKLLQLRLDRRELD